MNLIGWGSVKSRYSYVDSILVCSQIQYVERIEEVPEYHDEIQYVEKIVERVEERVVRVGLILDTRSI